MKSLEERSRGKWALQANAPLPKPGCNEYTPEMIAWQAEYNAYMEDNFGGRIDMLIVPFIEMPEYKEPLNKLEKARDILETRQPKAQFDCFWGYIYDDPDAGKKWEQEMGALTVEINRLKDEAEQRSYGDSAKRAQRIQIGDDMWSYDEYIAMIF